MATVSSSSSENHAKFSPKRAKEQMEENVLKKKQGCGSKSLDSDITLNENSNFL
jgi:hypothetical protein